MKLGDKVKCTAYIKKSGHHYEIISPEHTINDIPVCLYWENGSSEALEVEDEHSFNKFKIIQSDFTGIYCGITIRCTSLRASYEFDGYRNYIELYSDNPQEFAIVYYADNKKRLVPIDRIMIV